MRGLLTIVMALVASSSALAEPRSLMKRSVDENTTLEIRYDGEGWRNLRKVTFVTNFDDVELPSDYYFICGTDILLDLADTDPGQALSKGISYNLKTEELILLTPLNDDIRKASLEALTPICNREPDTLALPKYIGLSMSRDQLTYLLPERFSRSGEQVSVWMRTDHFNSEQRKLPWGAEFTVSFRDAERGYAIQKMEINCGTGRYRVMNSVDYRDDGTPVDGTSFATDHGQFSKTVPGSVGEAKVATSCLIR